MEDGTLYKPEHYAQQFLKNLSHLRKTDDFCDVTIKVEDTDFRAHRNVLASASPYFQAMLTGGMAEAGKEVIEIHQVSPKVFSTVLNFIYTGEVRLTEENCQDLLAVADMLGLSDVLEVCCDFLKTQLHPSNAIGILRFAEAHGCVDLRGAAEGYIHNHFLRVAEEEEYTDVPKELLIKILASEHLRIDSEFQVFTSAMDWILHDTSARRKHVFELLGPVRFPIISALQLERYIDECSDLSLKVALRKLAQDYRRDRRAAHEMRPARVKPNMMKPRKAAMKNVYVLGGYSRLPGGRWSDSRSLSSVECYNSFTQEWLPIVPLRLARSGNGVTVLDGTIYVAGGESDSMIYDSVESYDPAENKWQVLPSMAVPRCGLGLAALDGAVYAIGGWVGLEIGDSVERYIPSVGAWTRLDTMQTRRFAFGVTTCQDLIYVVGGMGELDVELRTVESYNPVTREWRHLSRMATPRAYVGVAVLDDHIYAVGGWNEKRRALRTVERYSIEDDVWTETPHMCHPRAGASVAAVNGLLYVVGGRSSSDEYSAPVTLDSVECYDPQTHTWIDVGNMNTGRCEAGVAVL